MALTLVAQTRPEKELSRLCYPPAPAILRKNPLVFGDVEQIAALREYERRVAELEQERLDLLSGAKRKFEIEVEVSGSVKLSVVAADVTEAKELARDMWDIDGLDDYDADYRVVSVLRGDQ